MLAIPAAARSEAGIAAVSCVAELKVVGRSALFHRTTEACAKFEPLTVSVKAGLPALAEFGVKTGHDRVGLLMLKGSAVDSPPPGEGVKTVTLAAPAAAMSDAVIAAVS